MASSFKDTSTALCNAIALVAKRLATNYVDPKGLEALLANRGVALSKDPSGVRPVGIGEMLRRILGKVILAVFDGDVQRAAGPIQLCAGQSAGVEAAVHAMRTIFDSQEAEAALFIDAENAFNKVNRQTGLHNIQYLCPPLKHILTNFYRSPSRIFLKSEDQTHEFSSEEGTTQGCPLAMAMYALSIAPLVTEGKSLCQQVWFADDGAGCDTVARLRKWYEFLASRGPQYGYYPKPKKCVLVVKEDKLEEAKRTFEGTEVTITTGGARHLGAALGSAGFKREFVEDKVKGWVSQVEQISRYAKTEPHAAFAAFTHCLQARWTFVSRTVPGAGKFFVGLEAAIRETFLPALLRRSSTLLALPARYGGLGIFNPCEKAPDSIKYSEALCAPLVALILRQADTFDPFNLKEEQKAIRAQQDVDLQFHMERKIGEISSKSSRKLQRVASLLLDKKARRVGSPRCQAKNTTQCYTKGIFWTQSTSGMLGPS